jgi:hypothetical protein
MTTHEQLLASIAVTAGEPTAPLSKRIGSIGRRLAGWAETCADYYAAAAMYQQLSALSGAELSRRGLSRATLARDVCTACDRNANGVPTGEMPLSRSR